MKSGSRGRLISDRRNRIAVELIESNGIPVTTVTLTTGVAIAAISKMMRK